MIQRTRVIRLESAYYTCEDAVDGRWGLPSIVAKNYRSLALNEKCIRISCYKEFLLVYFIGNRAICIYINTHVW